MTKEEILYSYKDAEKCSDIDWDLWEPDDTERCVLSYIVDEENDRMLFIEKLRGMGTGLLNGPGGHIEPGEDPVAAAAREIKEETGLDVRAEDLEERAMLSFQFRDGMRMGGRVYYCRKWSGELIDRSDETIPRWYDRKDVDYSRMWEDDVLWLPDFLAGKSFWGRFIFDGQKLIDSSIIYYGEK